MCDFRNVQPDCHNGRSHTDCALEFGAGPTQCLCPPVLSYLILSYLCLPSSSLALRSTWRLLYFCVMVVYPIPHSHSVVSSASLSHTLSPSLSHPLSLSPLTLSLSFSLSLCLSHPLSLSFSLSLCLFFPSVSVLLMLPLVCRPSITVHQFLCVSHSNGLGPHNSPLTPTLSCLPLSSGLPLPSLPLLLLFLFLSLSFSLECSQAQDFYVEMKWEFTSWGT